MRLLMRFALIVIGCLLLLGSGLVAFARRDATTDVTWIYYASVDSKGVTGLYRMLSDGSGQQLLVGNTGFITRISISPDGSSIVFDADRGENGSHVYHANAVGGNMAVLSKGFDEAYAPSWSPDGEWIALMTCNARDISFSTSTSSICYLNDFGGRQGMASVYVMRPDGTDRQRLAESIRLGRPFWSPDGEWIAYVSPGINDADIARIRPDGTAQERLTDVELAEAYANQPPFVGTPNQGPSAVPVFPSGGRDLSPTWSPDGSQIAFLSNRFDDQYMGYYDLDVFLMNADGSNITRLTNTGGQTGAPQWSPDGEWIAFVDDSDGVYNIYRIRPDGSNFQQLTHNQFRTQGANGSGGNGLNDQANSWAPSWSPPIKLVWHQHWAFVAGGLLLVCSMLTLKRHREFASDAVYQRREFLRRAS
jgi:TolB protein